MAERKKYKVGLTQHAMVTWTVMAYDEKDAVENIKKGFGRPAGVVGPVSDEWLVNVMGDKDAEEVVIKCGDDESEVRPSNIISPHTGRPATVVEG